MKVISETWRARRGTTARTVTVNIDQAAFSGMVCIVSSNLLVSFNVHIKNLADCDFIKYQQIVQQPMYNAVFWIKTWNTLFIYLSHITLHNLIYIYILKLKCPKRGATLNVLQILK